MASDSSVALAILYAMDPPLSSSTMDSLETAIMRENVDLKVMAVLGHEGLRDVCQVDSFVERSRILALLQDSSSLMGPPPLGPNGEPVLVYQKIGLVSMQSIDTVEQTAWMRFFLDLYWVDPAFIGKTQVPKGTWHPAGSFVSNQHGQMEQLMPAEKPILFDSKIGMLMWPVEIYGCVKNPLNLRTFPFDVDALELRITQAETCTRDEFVFRPWPTREQESQSVRFFFDVWAETSEWNFLGFTRCMYETLGGNSVEYSSLEVHFVIVRRWGYYIWKIVFPIFLCSLFSFSALLFEVDDLEARNNTSVTMFLASSALQYVVASTLPKTPYLTAMDKFLVVNLMLQFAVAPVSWICAGAFFPIEPSAALSLNRASTIVLPVLLVLSTLLFFLPPLLHALCWPCHDKPCHNPRHEKPARTLVAGSSLPRPPPAVVKGEDPALEYHLFERFANVFPRVPPGKADPMRLPPKAYPPKESASSARVAETAGGSGLQPSPSSLAAAPGAAASPSAVVAAVPQAAATDTEAAAVTAEAAAQDAYVERYSELRESQRANTVGEGTFTAVLDTVLLTSTSQSIRMGAAPMAGAGGSTRGASAVTAGSTCCRQNSGVI